MSNLRKRNVSKIESDFVTQHEKKVQTVEKKKRGLVRRLTVFGAAAILLSCLLISTLVSQASELEQKKEQKNKLKDELTSLQKQQDYLQEEVVKLNDDEYIAKLARRDYFLSDKGEVIFNLPKKKEDSDSY
ncbi:FtsB family cell division protein [Peribacillus deserti]|uniref:Cell division protein DIVIC n=1 Tax=Peribacillus deserti TaxID=673318 RepID=A0A2N5M908_9BACI|nr:septum formation initiator family protein [Peribacillus deserti]PLT30846.1 cell division protein DIVIC [Peribacillus deserti]